MTLQTHRLKLRHWKKNDDMPFAALNADPRVMEFFPSLLSRQQSDKMADKLQGLITERGWGFWAVELIGVAPFIGFVGLHSPEHALPFVPCVEIGWRLAADHWGHGYASEAATIVLRFAFDELKLDEVVSFTSVCNMRSQAVMRRVGMQHHGEFFEHPALPPGHALRSHILYRINKNSRNG